MTGVVGACDQNRGHFYITTTDFWTGAHLNSRPLPIGGVEIVFNGNQVGDVRQKQEMSNAVILSEFGDNNLYIETCRKWDPEIAEKLAKL